MFKGRCGAGQDGKNISSKKFLAGGRGHKSGQKIAPHVVNHARLGSVNLHASLLPRYRGAAPINWAIICGERKTGNSVIRLAQKMDAGAILGQSEVEIGELETAGELHNRLAV